MDWDNLPLLLRVHDVQKILNISRGKTYELVNSKDFPVIKIGRCLRIPRDAFREWVKRKYTA